jgi:HlyD family secretion protein
MKKVLRIALILLLAVALVIGYSLYKKHKNKPEWRMDTTSYGTIREEVTASGTLNPSSKVEVGTEISGKIFKLYKDFNDTVRRGELLAKLDTENLESSLEAARSDVAKAQINLDDAKLDLDLQKELFKQQMSTSYDLQKAQSKYDQAVQSLANTRSTLKRAEKNLNNAIITSPIDGTVISRNVEEGQTVAASMNAPTLFVIANNLRKMQISADVDEADIGKIRVGEPVEFTVDAFADEQFEGRVNQVRLSPSSTNNVVTYTVIIDVDNHDLKLLPGMTANVTIVVQEKENVLRIPETAVRFKPSKELWQQFGLKWDETALRSFSGRPRQADNSRQSGSGQPAMASAQSDRSPSGRPDVPDSLRAKLEKMTPEQRKVYFEKLRKSRSAEEIPAGQKQFSTQNQNLRTPEKTSRSRIWILKDGKPQPLEVVTGLSDGTYVQVISGITEGQEFITGVNYKNAKQVKNGSSSAFGPGGGFGPR